MNSTFKQRLILISQFGILFAQLLGLGFVAIGQANDVTGMAASGPEADATDRIVTFSEQIRAEARNAARATRTSVISDLGIKLDDGRPSTFRLADNSSGNRG